MFFFTHFILSFTVVLCTGVPDCALGGCSSESTALFQKRRTRGSLQVLNASEDLVQVDGTTLTCNLLEQTPSATASSFENFKHGSDYEGLYVNEAAQIAFCLIEKNACSPWTVLFQRLEKDNLDISSAQYGMAQKTFTDAKAQAVFDNPDAVRAVFVRDPLERFLSGFLDKCTGSECNASFCFARPKELAGQPIAFSVAVEWLRNLDHPVGEPPASTPDGHFSLQSRHCELHKRIHEYNLIGVMSSDSLAVDATCLLDRAGLSSLNVQNSTNSSPFWRLPDDTKFSTGSKTDEYLQAFYTKEAAELIYKAFEEDYVTFSLPRPSWIDNAHGRFYDDTQPLSCTDHHKVAGLLETEETDHSEDGIVALAEMAGFML